eukprot:g45093.t1
MVSQPLKRRGRFTMLANLIALCLPVLLLFGVNPLGWLAITTEAWGLCAVLLVWRIGVTQSPLFAAIIAAGCWRLGLFDTVVEPELCVQPPFSAMVILAHGGFEQLPELFTKASEILGSVQSLQGIGLYFNNPNKDLPCFAVGFTTPNILPPSFLHTEKGQALDQTPPPPDAPSVVLGKCGRFNNLTCALLSVPWSTAALRTSLHWRHALTPMLMAPRVWKKMYAALPPSSTGAQPWPVALEFYDTSGPLQKERQLTLLRANLLHERNGSHADNTIGDKNTGSSTNTNTNNPAGTGGAAGPEPAVVRHRRARYRTLTFLSLVFACFALEVRFGLNCAHAIPLEYWACKPTPGQVCCSPPWWHCHPSF